MAVTSPTDKLRMRLLDAVSCLQLRGKGHLNEIFVSEIPKNWVKHGDLVIIPQNCFRGEQWRLLGDDLFKIVCDVLKCKRVARRNPIQADIYRSSKVELLWGRDGFVSHTDNRIVYQWDVTKCMFSIGNITEKLRIARFDCRNEIVVDLFAGIGYFVLPYLVHARAKHVHACEINPASVEALIANLKRNKVHDRCTVHVGDNRQTCPEKLADRVNLGLIPSSEISWETACRALRSDSGGILHIHSNVDSKSQNRCKSGIFKYTEWQEWNNYVLKTISDILQHVKHKPWQVRMVHLEHVKSYAAHVDHLVLDVHCSPICNDQITN